MHEAEETPLYTHNIVLLVQTETRKHEYFHYSVSKSFSGSSWSGLVLYRVFDVSQCLWSVTPLYLERVISLFSVSPCLAQFTLSHCILQMAFGWRAIFSLICVCVYGEVSCYHLPECFHAASSFHRGSL